VPRIPRNKNNRLRPILNKLRKAWIDKRDKRTMSTMYRKAQHRNLSPAPLQPHRAVRRACSWGRKPNGPKTLSCSWRTSPPTGLIDELHDRHMDTGGEPECTPRSQTVTTPLEGGAQPALSTREPECSFSHRCCSCRCTPRSRRRIWWIGRNRGRIARKKQGAGTRSRAY